MSRRDRYDPSEYAQRKAMQRDRAERIRASRSGVPSPAVTPARTLRRLRRSGEGCQGCARNHYWRRLALLPSLLLPTVRGHSRRR